MTDLIYAGVGSRRTPSIMLESMTSLAYQMAQSGWHLRSGFADGADKAFGLGASQQAEEHPNQNALEGGYERYTMYVPWDGFNGAPKGDDRFKTVLANDELYEIAKACHPAWDMLSHPAKLLMIRNVAIVGGPNLGTPAACVIGWTPDAKSGGGTGHVFRVAKFLKVPTFDLASAYDQRAVVEFINGYQQKMEAIPWSYNEEEQDFARARVESFGMDNN